MRSSERHLLAFLKFKRVDVARFDIERHGAHFGNAQRLMHGVAKPLVELQLYVAFKHVKLERFVGQRIYLRCIMS